MATLRRVPVVWSGLSGLPGLSVFYTDTADDVTTNLATFFSSVSNRFPNGLSWSCAGSGDLISDVTGQITGLWTGGTPFTQTGSGGATAYAAGTGAFVRWDTSTILSGRRLRGRTFLCPLLASAYQADGSIDNSVLSALQTNANTLVAAAKLRIWHRPDPGFVGGTSAAVTAAVLPDKVTSLKSRRS